VTKFTPVHFRGNLPAAAKNSFLYRKIASVILRLRDFPSVILRARDFPFVILRARVLRARGFSPVQKRRSFGGRNRAPSG
jgi:hypothetical protein